MNAGDTVRLLLAGVLLFSAIGKARGGLDRLADTLDRYAILPMGNHRVTAAVFVVFEAGTGLLLLTPWYRIGAALAVLLTLAFAYAVSTALARGEIFACGCFGPALRITTSPPLLAFDLVLFGCAFFLLDADAANPWAIAWPKLALAVVGALAVGGAVQAARVAFFPDVAAGLPEGSRAPAVVVTCASGTQRRIDELAERGTILVFVTLECAACARLLHALSAREDRSVAIMIITPDSAQALIERHAWDPHWTCGGTCSRELRRVFRIPGHPGAVALGAQRVLGTAFPATPAAIEEAAARVVRSRPPANAKVLVDASHRMSP